MSSTADDSKYSVSSTTTDETRINDVSGAIEIWEQGVLKEKDGSMSDAINYYRKALKIDENVEKIYRKKLHVEWELQKKLEALKLIDDNNDKSDAIDEDDEKQEREKNILPCWLLEMLPNDLLLKIIHHVVLMSGESWYNLSLTCSHLNKLCFHDLLPYQTFANFIYSKQTYDNIAMELNGMSNLQEVEKDIWGDDVMMMLRKRPFVKFEGVYISVVNYLRYGSNAEGSSSLLNPVHMITYYRYFRFYEDGTCLRLLTTDEPSQVVKHFYKERKPKDSHLCSWTLGFDYNFGQLHVSRTTSKYHFVEEFRISSQGNKRHHKLKWIKSTVESNDGSISNCSLANEKSFSFSRVRKFA
ncbi:SCF ubiquitin ligase complex subunit HRT3 NDAI_0B02510 [Naumovozyma dairenensis CBS 421]|uniref:F-box domain-containing protein n=1 Tax=Naumovozyma dairenensis (strain ATCC 10597 / BCRC 20456 / CBS 421 / NBRC 0211 / NRRL Y-12639) TaxID=1071378 RepID=G0W675_NAUDC|nr:hypothetical protein NDAI_0B02510 [Naumovozyma dairenensis CBS 421]CCD23286.1 hypothetical protein NDAI_0B02510 [Naumovozyma dairenensis CBS 421]